MRTFSLILVAALTVMVAGAAFAGPNCDSHKATADAANASVENAKAEKAEGCAATKLASAKKAEACAATKLANAEKGAACAAKKAALASAESDRGLCLGDRERRRGCPDRGQQGVQDDERAGPLRGHPRRDGQEVL